MKNVLFLAPCRKYAETTIKNITEVLNKLNVDYAICEKYVVRIVLTTEGVKVTFLWKDPSEYKNFIRGMRFDAVYGKRELIDTFYSQLDPFTDFITPGISLTKYILKYSECGDNTNEENTLSEKTFGYIPEIKNVYFNDPYTIVMWSDGTKTMVRCQDGDTYSKEVGLALCVSKKSLGNKPNFNNVFKKFIQ